MNQAKGKDEALIFKPAFKLSAMSLAIVLMIGFLLWVPGLLSSLLIAIIFVFIMSPGVDFFERHGISRSNSILIVLGLVGLVVALTAMLLSQMVIGEYEDLVSRMDVYSAMLKDELNRQAAELEMRFGLDRYAVASRLINMAQAKLSSALQFTGATLATLTTWLAVVPLLSFFFLLDGHKIKKAVIGFLPNRYFEMSLNIHQKIARIVGNFIRAKLIESFVVGVCAMIGFIIVGIVFEPLNYAIFLAILVGLFNIIPYLGPLIGAVPVLVVAVVQYVLMPQFPEFSASANSVPSWAPVLMIAGVLAFAQIVDNVYLIPVLLGKSVNVHPLVVLGSVILGAKMLGVLGMIISIPLASILQTMVHEIAEGVRHLRH